MKQGSVHGYPRIAATDEKTRYGAGLLRRAGQGLRTYVAAYRQAKSAEQLYARLSRLSDRDLALHGYTRENLMQQVRARMEQLP